MNPLEDNYRMYKVVGGNRQQLDSSEVKIPTWTWHTRRVVQKGNHIQCYLDGKEHLDLVDERGWISDADYREGLTLSQLAPGPLAAQLAIELGYGALGDLGLGRCELRWVGVDAGPRADG